MAEDIVIVDKNGDEHHFPAGMDPKKAAAIVRKSLGMPDAAPESVTVTPPKQTMGNPGGNIPIAGWQPKGTFDTTEEDTTAGKVAQTLSLASVDPLTGLGAPVDAMFGGPGQQLVGAAARQVGRIPFRSLISGGINKLSDAADYVLPKAAKWLLPEKSIMGRIAEAVGETPRQMPKGYYGTVPPAEPKAPIGNRIIGGIMDRVSPKPMPSHGPVTVTPGVERVPYSAPAPTRPESTNKALFNAPPSEAEAASMAPGYERFPSGSSAPAAAPDPFVAGMPDAPVGERGVPYSRPNPEPPPSRAAAVPPGGQVTRGKVNNAGGTLAGKAEPPADETAAMLDELMGMMKTEGPTSVELPPQPGMTEGGRPTVSATDYMGADPALTATGREAGAPLSAYAPEPPAPAEVGKLTGRTAPAPEDPLRAVLTDMQLQQGPESVSLPDQPDLVGGGPFRQSGTFGKSGRLGQNAGYSSGTPAVSDTSAMEGWAGYERDGADVLKRRNAFSSGDLADPEMYASPNDLGIEDTPLPTGSETGAATEQPVTSLAEPATAAPAAGPELTADIAQQARTYLGSRDAARALGISQEQLLQLAPGPSRQPAILGELAAGGDRGDLTKSFLEELVRQLSNEP